MAEWDKRVILMIPITRDFDEERRPVFVHQIDQNLDPLPLSCPFRVKFVATAVEILYF